ncbi:MAG: acyl carrier protein [Asgard group archaeon]|nr:acyl carrier protein [Asgard group archaeon]
MTEALDKLYTICSKILLIDKTEINGNISRKDIEEWDSMAHLILVSELEQNFDIIMEDEEIANIKNISDIKDALKKYGVEI